jgi:pimeloyl-ACP methyl ester carboxylesterase
MSMTPPYVPRRAASSRFVTARGLRHHVLQWGDFASASAERPPLVLLHGWMDVAASFQFVVDALDALEGDSRCVIALDWRGFGQTESPALDTYWFPDYLGDLDALLDAMVEPVFPGLAVDLMGHSMGGNVAMLYAGVRPTRVRRLVNLEGFGMPPTRAEQAPRRYAQWLDSLREPSRLRPYATLAEVAARLQANNPLLPQERAAWLAAHWSRPTGEPEGSPGAYALAADPNHKRVNPILYRHEEVMACWQQITAPLLWVEGNRSDVAGRSGQRDVRAEFHERLAVVPQVEKCRLAPAGHMLHHDQPEALAQHLRRFLDAPPVTA